ncbi:hypothetical protein IE077_002432 [Cardiosporidium cionae]|uniref:Uncharacterized protein n=1 Tax=Cardiosporidium cionae TaxID=476202 RepID=A0ABQ7JAV9_9APIC|nr:hypothetical protein IE077_002432 [Cardiosporidium cionae]|eukprot:KAF8821135.1 hypothetical protein IE077_002432 [Cardiosporidium cionae]
MAALKDKCVAVSKINSSYANGYVTKMAHLTLLDISLNMEILRTTFSDQCEDGFSSLTYHDHVDWIYGNETVLNDEGLCTFAGSHYDPGYACGPTGHSNCTKYGIPGSSALLHTTYYTGNYTCNPEIYKSFPYSCHVGDITGKFGAFLVPNPSNKTIRFIRVLYDPYSAQTCNAGSLFKSAVMHCNSGFRLFCWPWSLSKGIRPKMEFLENVINTLWWIDQKQSSLQEHFDVDAYINIDTNTLLKSLKQNAYYVAKSI